MPRPIYLFSTSSHPQAKSINSLDIKLLKPSIDFFKYDYFIITSKQAVKALNQYAKREYIDIPALCVSDKSADAYEEIGGKVLASANGYGSDLCKIIKKHSHAKKWLYLRGKVIASDFTSTCSEEGYRIDEEVVYESRCSNGIKEVGPESESVLIFTSPSSIKCFLKSHEIPIDADVVVIGKTTAKALPKSVKYHLCENPSIENCIELAQKL